MPRGAEYIFRVQDIGAFELGRDSHILLYMLSSENLQEITMENSFPSGTCKRPQLTLALASGLYLELCDLQKPWPSSWRRGSSIWLAW